MVAGWGLLGTYTFYAVVTSTAAGIFGTAFLKSDEGLAEPPQSWAPFLLAGVALALTLAVAVFPARRGANVLLSVEGATVALILIVTVIVLVRLLSGSAPSNHHFTLSVFTVPAGTSFSPLFLGVVFGFLSFAGFEAAATLGEEATHPTRDIPRAILGTAIFGGIYFVVVTAVEMMGFGTSKAGVTAFASSPSLLGDLGTSYVGAWIGDIITLGTTISAFGCCLASTVAASRLTYALARDAAGCAGGPGVADRGTRHGHPGDHGLLGGDLRDLHRRLPRQRRGQLRLVGHDWDADPAGRLRARDHRLHHAGVRAAEASGADVAARRPAAGAGCTRLHALPQRDPVSAVRPGPLVPGGLRAVARRLRSSRSSWLPASPRRLGAALTASEGIGAPERATAAASTQLPAGDTSGECGPRMPDAEDAAAGPRSRVDGLLPFVRDLPLVDHHCHGVIRRDVGRRDFEALLTEADYPDHAGWTGQEWTDGALGPVERKWVAGQEGLTEQEGPTGPAGERGL